MATKDDYIELPVNCIVCGKEIVVGDYSEEYEKVPNANMNFDGGVVDTMVAGYGSRHDCDVFAVGVCDDCIDKAVKKKRAQVIRQMYGAETMEELSKVARGMRSTWETGRPFWSEEDVPPWAFKVSAWITDVPEEVGAATLNELDPALLPQAVKGIQDTLSALNGEMETEVLGIKTAGPDDARIDCSYFENKFSVDFDGDTPMHVLPIMINSWVIDNYIPEIDVPETEV